MADFSFDPYSGLAPGGLPAPGDRVFGRGYDIIGESIFDPDVGVVALPVGYWVAFASTNLDSAAWFPAAGAEFSSGHLFVRFLSYAVYRYDGVPAVPTWRDLLVSPSHGSYFANKIKPYWTGIRIQGPMREVTKEIIEAHSGRSHV